MDESQIDYLLELLDDKDRELDALAHSAMVWRDLAQLGLYGMTPESIQRLKDTRDSALVGASHEAVREALIATNKLLVHHDLEDLAH